MPIYGLTKSLTQLFSTDNATNTVQTVHPPLCVPSVSLSDHCLIDSAMTFLLFYTHLLKLDCLHCLAVIGFIWRQKQKRRLASTWSLVFLFEILVQTRMLQYTEKGKGRMEMWLHYWIYKKRSVDFTMNICSLAHKLQVREFGFKCGPNVCHKKWIDFRIKWNSFKMFRTKVLFFFLKNNLNLISEFGCHKESEKIR